MKYKLTFIGGSPSVCIDSDEEIQEIAKRITHGTVLVANNGTSAVNYAFVAVIEIIKED